MGSTCRRASTPGAHPAGSSAASAHSSAARRARPTGTPSCAHTPSRCVRITSLTSWAVRALGAPGSLSIASVVEVAAGAAPATASPAFVAGPCSIGGGACSTALVGWEEGLFLDPLGLSASSSMCRSMAATSTAGRELPHGGRARPEATLRHISFHVLAKVLNDVDVTCARMRLSMYRWRSQSPLHAWDWTYRPTSNPQHMLSLPSWVAQDTRAPPLVSSHAFGQWHKIAQKPNRQHARAAPHPWSAPPSAVQTHRLPPQPLVAHPLRHLHEPMREGYSRVKITASYAVGSS